MDTPTERKTVPFKHNTHKDSHPKLPERLKTSRAPNSSHRLPASKSCTKQYGDTNISAKRDTFIPYEKPRKHPHPKIPQHFKKSKAPDSSTSTPFSEARNMSIGCPSRFL